MTEPRLDEIAEQLEFAKTAALGNDEQRVLECLYYVRELAWSINADILARRWDARELPKSLRRPPLKRVTIDDLLI